MVPGATPSNHPEMPTRRVLTSLLAVAVAAAFVPQPTAAQPAPAQDVTPDDYASVATVTELAVSPDGTQVAYCLATWDEKADNRRTDLWVVATDGQGKPRQPSLFTLN